jgi:exonuclease III
VKLLSWNVSGRVKNAARRQLDTVLERDADVIALQEVTAGNYPDWCSGLTGAGYS